MHRWPILAAALLATAAAAQTQAQDPSVEFRSQATQGDWVLVDRVTLPDGGFVAIHDSQGPGPSSVVGVSVFLGAGNHSHVPVEAPVSAEGTFFAVLHEDDGDEAFGYTDSDGEQDPPLVAGGRTVAAPAQLTPGEVATVRFDDQELDDTVEVAAASLPSGGFVAIHREEFLDGEYFSSTLATSGHLQAGDHTNVSVPIDLDSGGFFLAVVHLDSDGDGVYDFDISQGKVDPAYIDGSLPVLDRAAVRNPGDGNTVGAGRDTGDGQDNGTPAPAALLLALALGGAAAVRRR